MTDSVYRRKATESQKEYDRRIRRLLPPVFEGILETDEKPLTDAQKAEVKRRLKDLNL